MIKFDYLSFNVRNLIIALISGLIVFVLIQLIYSIIKTSIITYSEIPLNIGLKYDKKTSRTSFEPLNTDEIQGKMIVFSHSSAFNNQPAKVEIVDNINYNLDEFFLGWSPSNTPWDILANIPKIVFFKNEYSIRDLRIPKDNTIMLFISSINSNSTTNKFDSAEFTTESFLFKNQIITRLLLYCVFFIEIIIVLTFIFLCVRFFIHKENKLNTPPP